MSWFAKGNDANVAQLKSIGNDRKTFRFYLNSGTAKEILFLDDPNFFANEYNFKMGEKEFMPVTCKGEDCLGLVAGHRPYGTYFFTVLDMTPYKDKKNVEHKYSKKLFAIKGKGAELLNIAREQAGGSLAGVKVKVTRTTAKGSSSTGDSFAVVSRIKLDSLPDADRKPIDYEKELAPPSDSKMEAILKRAFPPGNSKTKSQTVSRDSFGEEPISNDFGPEVNFTDESEIPF